MKTVKVLIFLSTFLLLCETFELNVSKICFFPTITNLIRNFEVLDKEQNLKLHTIGNESCSSVQSSFPAKNSGVNIGLLISLNTLTLNLSCLGVRFLEPLPPTLKEVQSFIASHNAIEMIPNDLFKNMEKLNEIDLSFNEILHFNETTFSRPNDTVSLTILNISNNRLENVTFEDSGKWGKLRSLDLSHNRIEKLEIKVELPELETIDLSFNILKFLLPFHARNLRRFLASNNEFMGIPDRLFNEMEETLTEIDFSFNKIARIYDFVFENLKTLAILNMSHNCIISLETTTENAWNFHRLKMLDLSYNRIENVNANLFAKAENLEEFHLENNRIKTIELKTKLDKISYVNLATNQIEEKNISNLISNLGQSLKKLDLSRNALTHVNLTALSRNSTNLQWLSLSDNDLTHLDNVTREQFPNISALDISWNHISRGELNSFMEQWKNVTNITDPYIQKILSRNHGTKTVFTQKISLVEFIVVFIIAVIVVLLMCKCMHEIRRNSKKEKISNEQRELNCSGQYENNGGGIAFATQLSDEGITFSKKSSILKNTCTSV